jgi:Flp pilus assembly protein TadD
MVRPADRLIASVCLAVSLTTGGCALGPVSGTPSSGGVAESAEPTAASSASPAAVLLEQSQAARANGDYGRAATAVERAVRLEPNDPTLWLEYGRLQLALGNFDQALAQGRRAANLAGGDGAIRSEASRLIAAANRERARADAAAAREAERH